MRFLLGFFTAIFLATTVLCMSTSSVNASRLILPKVEGPIPVTDSSVPFNAAADQVIPIDLNTVGYLEEEYFLSGKANIYIWDKPGFAEVRTANAPYTNRIMVRRPSEKTKFSGNVFVEVVNTTSQYDVQSQWGACYPKFLRDGDIYIGITSKPVAVAALKRYAPERYAPLSWTNPLPLEQRGTNPGSYLPVDRGPSSTPENEDGLFWDMLTQLGLLLKSDVKDNVFNL